MPRKKSHQPNKWPKVKTTPEPERPPNPFQVQRMFMSDYHYITFNYHPFLNKGEALDLAIQLIAHSTSADEPLLKTAKRRLKELEAWLKTQLDDGDS